MRVVSLILLFALSLSPEAKCQHNSDGLPGERESGTVKMLSLNGGDNGELSNVDNFTGTLKVSVPLFNFQVENQNLNLSLNYAAHGLRQGQLPNPVGAGWYFSTGFKISRIVCGLPDEILQPSTSETQSSWIHNKKGFLNCDTVPLTTDKQVKKDYIQDNKDSEIDFFSLMINGQIVKFVIGKDGIAAPLSPCDYKIEYEVGTITYIDFTAPVIPPALTYEGIIKFTVTDNQNTKYYFGIKNRYTDISNYLYSMRVEPVFNIPYLDYTSKFVSYDIASENDWDIEKIEFADGTDILFNYSSPILQYFLKKPIYTKVKQGTGTCFDGPGTVPLAIGSQPYNYMAQLMYLLSSRSYLESIALPDNIEVKFKYKYTPICNNLTTSSQSFHCFDKIELYSNNILQRYYKLSHSFYDNEAVDGWSRFEDYCEPEKTSANYDYFLPWPESETKHLRLDSVVLNPINSHIRYSFNYETTKMPKKYFSMAWDHWGFYNGKNNTMVLPGADGLGNTLPSGADKSADFNFAKAGILQKITRNNTSTYTYEYESNQGKMFNASTAALVGSVVDGGGVRIKTVTIFDGISHQNDLIQNYSYAKADGTSSGILFCKPIYTKPFNCNDHGQSLYWRSFSMVDGIGFTVNGAYCGYSKVTVSQGLNGAGGKEEYNYTNVIDGAVKNIITGTDQLTPFINAQCLKDWRIGLLKSKLTYAYLNTNPIREENYEYDINEGVLEPANLYTSIRMELKEGHPQGINQHNYNDNFDWEQKTYHPYKGSALCGKQTTIDHFPASNLTVIKNYVYDSHRKIKEENFINSEGTTYKTIYYRAYDYSTTAVTSLTNNSSIGINGLLGSNLSSTLLRKDYLIKKSAATTFSYIGSDISKYQSVGTGQNGSILQPVEIYKLSTTQPIPETSFPAFDPNYLVPTGGVNYRKDVSNLYSVDGHNTETNQENKTKSFIWEKSKIVAVVSNSPALNCAYTSFETPQTAQNDPSVPVGNWMIYMWPSSINNQSVTGKNGYFLTASTPVQSARILVPNEKYIFTFWQRYSGSIAIANESTPITAQTILTLPSYWSLKRCEFVATAPPPGNSYSRLTLTGNTTIDELRLYPFSAQMETFSYDPLNGLISECDANDHVSRNEYDILGRMIITRDQDWNITKKIDYGIEAAE